MKRIHITDDLTSEEEVFLTTEMDLADLPDPDQRAELSRLSDKLKV